MRRALGDHSAVTLGKASFFGMVSSSCSYAASALAKSLFARGADFTASMVFMIASTNLVVELGIVLWLLIGWQFALAEFVGGAIMIVLIGLVMPRVIPQSWIADARKRLEEPSEQAQGQHVHATDAEAVPGANLPLRQRIRSRAGWGDASGYTISDVTMVRKELLIGFVVAGFLTALVPNAFWQALFVTGHGFWSSLQNVVLGPFLAIISFVCSVGNVPLAAALWKGGISFGGVVSFVFADLITLPLLSIYRKYFGTAITLRILAVFWATMSTAGLAVEYLFRGIGITDPVRPKIVVRTGFQWNYTSVLNIIALIAFAGLYWLYKTRGAASAERYGKDPVCGMQIEKVHAPATATSNGEQYWFCSDHCKHRFTADIKRFAGSTPNDETKAGAVDPVCKMTVDPTLTPHTADHGGNTYYFCAAGCQSAFLANPDRYLSESPALASDGRSTLQIGEHPTDHGAHS
jgi:YHS domain-containing protein